ncbi:MULTISPECIES: hypothetical protein [unclassified Serratia (in: enterobacteria)]|uniref:hypothetical protein n=1 Tax=unclassified Serratia (in: enterobacteria) TaxID=2647522 RepID=UPI002ED5A75E|nr:hypothetical protein [Serratia sp. C2(2)]MEE4448112.1 hypothetical protein [Serratia sp. C2(1)]
MKRINLPYFIINITLYLISTVPAQAALSGTIHFRGTIVEPACQINHQRNQLNIDCSARNDRSVNSVAIISSSELQYLNNEKTLAIALVIYR